MALSASEPFDAHMSLHRALYLEAQRKGVRVMLDGAGGDVVLAGGNAVAELLLQGKFRAALRETNGYRAAARPASAIAGEILASAWAAFAPPRLRDWKRRLAARMEDHRMLSGESHVRPSFARRVRLAERRQRTRDHAGDGLPFGLAYRTLCIRHPHLVVGRERYDRVASAFAIEPRDPFLDVRVIQFCLTLPSEQLRSGGFRKAVLRRAMAGMLPQALAWRRGKEHLGWSFTQALFPGLGQRMRDRDASPLAAFVSENDAKSAVDTANSAIDSELRFALCVLLYWLSKN
jgi:asparagine synthase (glutamine-hydrolysing)